jgi:flagellar basal body-associated protein FliL
MMGTDNEQRKEPKAFRGGTLWVMIAGLAVLCVSTIGVWWLVCKGYSIYKPIGEQSIDEPEFSVTARQTMRTTQIEETISLTSTLQLTATGQTQEAVVITITTLPTETVPSRSASQQVPVTLKYQSDRSRQNIAMTSIISGVVLLMMFAIFSFRLLGRIAERLEQVNRIEQVIDYYEQAEAELKAKLMPELVRAIANLGFEPEERCSPPDEFPYPQVERVHTSIPIECTGTSSESEDVGISASEDSQQ